jgi:hypothetical protein
MFNFRLKKLKMSSNLKNEIKLEISSENNTNFPPTEITILCWLWGFNKLVSVNIIVLH